MIEPIPLDQKNSNDYYGAEETARRRDDAIRRALSTPPKPNKAYVGKSERAKARKRSRVKKAGR